jgi:hypothetical protein
MFIVYFIIISKTALFKPQPSLKISARLHLIYTSLDFPTVFLLQSKVVSFASNPQPGGPGACISGPQ